MPPTTTRLKAQGHKFVDEVSGVQWQGRGVCEITNRQWNDQGFSAADVNIADVFTKTIPAGGWEGNFLNLWANTDWINAAAPNNFEAYAFPIMAKVAANGGRTMISWHAKTGQTSHPPGSDAADRAAMAKLVKRIQTQTWAKSVFYNAQAEPGNSKGAAQSLTWPQLKVNVTAMIDAIRAEDPLALIICPGTGWSQHFEGVVNEDGTPNDPIERENIGYGPHVYNWEGFTSWAAKRDAMRIPQLAALFPTLLGEVSVNGALALPNPLDVEKDCDAKMIPWLVWNYSDAGAPCLLDSITPLDRSEGGDLLYGYMDGAVVPTFVTSATSTPNPVPVGQAATLNVHVVTTGGPLTALVDLELYNAQNQKVWQSFAPDKRLLGTQDFPFQLVGPGLPALPAGSYKMKVGIFPPTWGNPLNWNANAGTLVIQAPLPPLPVAGFSASPLVGTAPLNVAFLDNSSGIIASKVWDFGDGETSTQNNPLHTYAQPGTYTAKLTVTNAAGSNEATTTITVSEPLPALPVSQFTIAPQTGTAPLEVAFQDESTGVITGKVWDFGDWETSTEDNPVHTYQAQGFYTAKLTVTNAAGFGESTKQVSVEEPEPEPPPGDHKHELPGGGFTGPDQPL